MKRHRSWVEIDERALRGNIDALRALLSPGTRFCAVVKANAYGHGLKEVVQVSARNNVDAFAVDQVDDALFIRDLMPSALIIVLGYTLHDRFNDAIEANLHLTVYDQDSIRLLEETAAKSARQAFAHLKIETGTGRQGVVAEQLSDVLDLLSHCPHVTLAGLSTHFANVEDTADTRYATQQFARFQKACQTVRDAGFSPEWIHCACSAAIILYPDTHGTLVRSGISLYGLWSSPQTELTARAHTVSCDLTPVLTWKTRIAQVKALPGGTPVGYGLTEVLKRNSRIAVIPTGYWDGYDRKLSSVGEVLVAGHRCKVIGRVCMNMSMIDVSDVPAIEPEQEVVLLGRSGRYAVTAESMAERVGTISYEVVTRINPLLPRLIV